ncbi:PREDICTED: uncharacterized protein LOC109585030 [Amphimedon queenslandica]|uniref:Uncharacterized protein n=1 Tax=Amphimedon queenslandica TaxID=400682 RepID=A0AAN0JHR4_AMPQE|nr:PREDICTED: uncharacterized protein LOC109585030 [Amphimedon queenslandica]|eukprot:XP_019856514.1 PREDICTED: uncharacterized protein LOC109585030 [Amphimedon queenslandica]
MPINEHIRNKINVEDSISSIAPLIYNSEYDTATAANPTNADLVKRTNTTPLPPAAQTVIYDKVTGDINKRGGGVTAYQPSESDDMLVDSVILSYSLILIL